MIMKMISIIKIFILFNLISRSLGQRDNIIPSLANFNVLSIKTPQLIGIALGCSVFFVTIGTVLYLLYLSGSFTKLMEELKNPNDNNSNGSIVSKNNKSLLPQFDNIPELYEHLINARKSLNIKPTLAEELKGNGVIIRNYNAVTDKDILIRSCNGKAQYNESAYDPARLWGWLQSKQIDTIINESNKSKDLQVDNYFSSLYSESKINENFLSIIDIELNRPIGMVTLCDNDTNNLSIRLENIWLTPAFQGKRKSHTAIYLLLNYLVEKGYRRIVAEVDERHIIGRKFFERCGFQLEATLRKHKIFHNRNINTSLYVLLNSDFIEIETKLRNYLGIKIINKTHNIAAIDNVFVIPKLKVDNNCSNKDKNDIKTSNRNLDINDASNTHGKKKKKSNKSKK